LALWKRLEIKAGHYAEVILTAFKRDEEVRSGGCIRIDDLSVGENELEVDDRVARPASFWGEE